MSVEKIPLWLARLLGGNKQSVNYNFDSAISGDDMTHHWAKSLSQKNAYKWKPYDPEQALSPDNYPDMDPRLITPLADRQRLSFLHGRHLGEQGTWAKGLDEAQLEQAHLDYENQRLNEIEGLAQGFDWRQYM